MADPIEKVDVKLEPSSQIRSAFETLSRAEAMYIYRETALKQQIQNQNIKIESLQEKNSLLSNENASLKTQLESLKQQVLDQKSSSARERQELLNRLEDERKRLSVLKGENCDLKCKGDQAETELDISKRRFEELKIRVLRLEKDCVWLEKGLERIDTVGCEKRNGDKNNVKVVNLKTEESEMAVGTETAKASNRNGDISNAGDRRSSPQNVIELSDDDCDEKEPANAKKMAVRDGKECRSSDQKVNENETVSLKRKRDLFSTVDKVNSETDKSRITEIPRSNNEGCCSTGFHFSSCSSASGSACTEKLHAPRKSDMSPASFKVLSSKPRELKAKQQC